MNKKIELLIIIILLVVSNYKSVLQGQQNKDKQQQKSIIYELKYEFTGEINNQGDSIFSFYYVFNTEDYDKISEFEISKINKIKSKKNTDIDSTVSIKETIKKANIKSKGQSIIKDNKVYIKIFQSEEKIPYSLKAFDSEGNVITFLYKNERGEKANREKDIMDYIKFYIKKEDSIKREKQQ